MSFSSLNSLAILLLLLLLLFRLRGGSIEEVGRVEVSKARDCVQQSRQRLEDLDAIARDEVLEEIEDVEEELMAAEGRVAAKEAAEQSNAVCVCLCVCARAYGGGARCGKGGCRAEQRGGRCVTLNEAGGGPKEALGAEAVAAHVPCLCLSFLRSVFFLLAVSAEGLIHE